MINEKEIFNALYNKYNKLFLNKDEISKELGISQATLNRRIKAKEALPDFQKEGRVYYFPLTSLCNYLLNLKSEHNFAF